MMEKYAWLIILTLVQIVQFLVIKKNGKVYKFNPHPPGEARRCQENRDIIIQLKTDFENFEKRLDRLEGKLNGMDR